MGENDIPIGIGVIIAAAILGVIMVGGMIALAVIMG